MDFSISSVIEFVVVYKWWIIACIPLLIVIMVVRARG